jgi:preprotein translocase subunit SecF
MALWRKAGESLMYHFYKNRKIFFALSIGIMLAGIIFSMVFGIQLDIQFKGGSILKYSFAGDLNIAQAKSTIEAAIGQPVSCQETTILGGTGKNLVINVAGDAALTPENQVKMENALSTSFPQQGFKLEEANLVDPFIGAEFFRNAIYAMIVASILIVAFVWFAFRSMSGPSAGVMALIALFHDVAVVFFVFVFLRIPLNESLVAVVLSILGFSINDTIVIYDRIRENKQLTNGRLPLDELVDLSINQSLTRSINTSLCVFGAITIAYIFAVLYGIDSIKEFALPMMIGTISGSYSTIFLAGPLWVMWKTRGGRTGY